MDYDYDFMGDDGEFYHDFYADNDALAEDESLKSPWDDSEMIPPMTMHQLFFNCIQPTLTDGLKHISRVLAWCVVYRLSTQIIRLPQVVIHLISLTCGAAVMYHFFGTSMAYIGIQGVVAYSALLLAHRLIEKRFGLICIATCLSFILTCELLVVNAVEWHMIRAAQMLVAMRAVSIGFQLDDKSLPTLPDPFAFFGYLYHVGTVAFGPWIPYREYVNIGKNRKLNFKWFYNIASCIALSLACLSVSACWMIWLIPVGSPKWFLAYRDALAFRSSHYFVSYLSEAAALASGMDSSNGDWKITVVRPLHIEFPRSLVEVVVNWNIPMHSWLRTYVFKVARPYGSFLAVLATYATSSLLHGLNFQLAAVLLSLGLYTYTEHVTRQKLSLVFSACIGARRCGAQCEHHWKEKDWSVRLANFGFSLVAVFHLAYLGLMFDSSKSQEEGYSYWHVLAKWRWLNFASHWTTLATYIFYLMI